MNCCAFVGRLATDVEYNENNPEMPVARFRIALRRYNPKEGEPTADFAPVVAFGGTARFIRSYFKKGDYIALLCRYKTRSYQADDGQIRHVHEFIAYEAHFSSNGNSGNGSRNGGSADVAAGGTGSGQVQAPRRAAPPTPAQAAPAVEVPF